jgi:hypothetical protein
MPVAVATMWLGLVTLAKKYEFPSHKSFDRFLTLTFRLLHCKHPVRDFRCDRRPGGMVDMTIIQGGT